VNINFPISLFVLLNTFFFKWDSEITVSLCTYVCYPIQRFNKLTVFTKLFMNTVPFEGNIGQ